MMPTQRMHWHGVQVLFSYMWELTVLKETINLVSAVGGVCVMVGVVVVALSGEQWRRHNVATTEQEHPANHP